MSHGADKVGICDFSAWRNLRRFDENHSAVANDGGGGGTLFGKTVSAATPLVGERLYPNVFVGAAEERVDGFGATCCRVMHLASNVGIILHGLGEVGCCESCRCG